jgi:hypothetical protein
MQKTLRTSIVTIVVLLVSGSPILPAGTRPQAEEHPEGGGHGREAQNQGDGGEKDNPWNDHERL